MSLSLQIRNEFIRSGRVVAKVSRNTGICRKALRRFVRGGSIKSADLDKVARYLGFSLVRNKPNEFWTRELVETKKDNPA